MLLQILSFLLDVVAGLFGGACLLRLYMQYQRIGFNNPVGRFVFALTDWIVLPLRRVLPSVRKVDTASLVAAYLIILAQFGILWLLAGRTNGLVVPLVAVFGLLRLAFSGVFWLMIVYVILSLARSDSPITDIIERLCAPMLRPFRRMLPLVGGFDLSPMALLIVLHVAGIVLENIQRAVLR